MAGRYMKNQNVGVNSTNGDNQSVQGSNSGIATEQDLIRLINEYNDAHSKSKKSKGGA